jgi:hypothetical protein
VRPAVAAVRHLGDVEPGAGLHQDLVAGAQDAAICPAVAELASHGHPWPAGAPMLMAPGGGRCGRAEDSNAWHRPPSVLPGGPRRTLPGAGSGFGTGTFETVMVTLATQRFLVTRAARWRRQLLPGVLDVKAAPGIWRGLASAVVGGTVLVQTDLGDVRAD